LIVTVKRLIERKSGPQHHLISIFFLFILLSYWTERLPDCRLCIHSKKFCASYRIWFVHSACKTCTWHNICSTEAPQRAYRYAKGTET